MAEKPSGTATEILSGLKRGIERPKGGTPNMRGDQIVRQWKIIRLMETRRYGISVAELAEELESQPRTIYRDLEALYDAGFPLYNDKDGKNSVWKLLDTFRKDFRIPFTVTE
jgi:proteasome accessory factor B